MAARGVSDQQLAAEMGISLQAVRKVRKGQSNAFSAGNNALAARFLSVRSDWLATGQLPRDLGVAHEVSPTYADHPTLTLEILMKLGSLPRLFLLAVPDGALGPASPKGTTYLWDTDREPTPERLIIVKDRHGHAHVRAFELGAEPGRWTARAHGAYPSWTDA
jgi:transcriptional regulator with XRE-family HTH domain